MDCFFAGWSWLAGWNATPLEERWEVPEACERATRDGWKFSPRPRFALSLALDEASEAETLEAEWRRAEELAAIVDGEPVPGFAEFRLRALRDSA